jgi:single-stranded DNA-binding protein
LRTRKWTDQGGQDHYSTEVVIGRFKGELVLLDSARDEDAAAVSAPSTTHCRASADLDDEIPF